MSTVDDWHHSVLRAIATSYRVQLGEGPRYLEVGVASGACWRAVAAVCGPSFGVDPNPAGLQVLPYAGRLCRMRSDDFFARQPNPVGQAHLIFIDGEHTYDQAVRDFANAAAVLAPGGTIAVHDVWPMEERYTSPRFCGDVFRLRADLEDDDEWSTFTVRTFPGLMLCQRRQP